MSAENNPYRTPESNVEPADEFSTSSRYMGFWARVAASIIDNILMLFIILPLLYLVYGQDYFSNVGASGGFIDNFISYVLPAIAILMFWTYKQATPGKMIFNAKIIDAKTGGKPKPSQWLFRYLGYIPSTLIFGLGFLWVIWDKRKQGWHDKMAGTVVVYAENE